MKIDSKKYFKISIAINIAFLFFYAASWFNLVDDTALAGIFIIPVLMFTLNLFNFLFSISKKKKLLLWTSLVFLIVSVLATYPLFVFTFVPPALL